MTAVATPPRAVTPDQPAPRRSVLATSPLGRGALVLLASGVLVGWRRAERPYADGDVLWGARTGLNFLHTGHLVRQDPYSWTAHGSSWVQNSWAWNVLLGVTYRVGGFVGLALLGIVFTSLIALLTGLLARRAGAAASASGMVFLITGGFFALFLYVRPQLADYIALLVLLLVLPSVYAAARGPAIRAGAGVVVLQVVWMNLHSTAMIGPVLILAAGLGRLVTSGPATRTVAVRTAALTVLTGLACLATPYGIAPITHANEVRASSVGIITEWLPAGFGNIEQVLGVVAIALGAIACALCWRARQFDMIAVLIVLGIACGTAIRFAPLLVLAAAPTLAAGFRLLPIRPVMMTRAWLVSAAVTAALCLAGTSAFGQPGLNNDSPALIAALPSGCRLFNGYDIGGAVILRRPDVPVAIDGRNDMYGRARVLQWFHAMADPRAGRRYIAKYHITCILGSKGAPTVQALARDSHWRVAAQDPHWALLLPSR